MKEQENDKWKDLGVRTKLLYISACLAFIGGWVLTFWGFSLPPKGVVDNSVIVILGQCLTYAAAAFGLGEYIQYQIVKYTHKKNGNE